LKEKLFKESAKKLEANSEDTPLILSLVPELKKGS
jgi:hypothetical protein